MWNIVWKSGDSFCKCRSDQFWAYLASEAVSDEQNVFVKARLEIGIWREAVLPREQYL